MKKFCIGIDVGGTNIKFGLVDPNGKIISRKRVSTKEFTSSKANLIKKILDTIQEIINDNKLALKNIEGIGFGFPGLVDPEKGVVKVLTNIPGWKNVPIKAIVEKKFKIPTFIDNDVNMITLGEWKFGAGKACSNLVCFTLGTGVGGGLILNNELFRGEGFVAGEIGHMPLNENGPSCNCGGFGCFERYVGNSQLAENAGKIFKMKNVQLSEIYEIACKGNTRAIEFWQKVGQQIGNLLVGIVNLLNPKLIIVGGGVGNAYSILGPEINKVIKQRAMKIPGSMVKLVKASLGDDAGIIGAKVLIKETLKKKK